MARNSSGFNAWSGWVAFAAVTLLTLGALNLIMGFTALFEHGYFVTTSGNLLVWRSFTTWGVILLCFGGLQLLIGLGLFTAKSWARYAAIALAVLNIIGQIAFLAAHPVWSVVVMALDLVVLYALTARWDEAVGGGGAAMPRAGEAEWQARTPAGRTDAGTAHEGRRHEGGSRMDPS
ncbi:hypothetical protein LO772_10910 [Yinghuangia sp. ASG 101]|uniref:DUF7144 family membrane protein n=1 Tax=Yinghuangia sp. ASG 101 TaxID=2896848 RepID=UPI001E470B57|nr:hypothetical protein [Yinghuangia sp. ASG 101]UGQ14061.1 hypothetical protein LO772_10910 [Yinghuangia sp. ASG 101]